MTNYRNKYKPRKNTPKVERREHRKNKNAQITHQGNLLVEMGLHTNWVTIERHLGHPCRGRKKRG